MNYCGLDVASVSSYAYVTDARGKKLFGGFVPTTLSGLKDLVERHGRGGLRLALEAGNQTTWIYHTLQQLGVQVTVVNPSKFTVIGHSRRKTDKIDAQLLAEKLRLRDLPTPVHMPSAPARALRDLLTARRQLIGVRTKLMNTVRSLLRQEGIFLKTRELVTFKGWDALLARSYEQAHLLPIVQAFHQSFVTVQRALKQLDLELAEREAADRRALQLRTMPKVGRVAALTMLAAVDDVRRFTNSRKFVSYTGLAPTVRQSNDRVQYGPISRAGRSELRGVWVQIAQLVANDRKRASQPLRRWFEKVAKKRGKKTAIVALARKLLTIAYQLLKTNTVYEVQRLKKVKPKNRAA